MIYAIRVHVHVHVHARVCCGGEGGGKRGREGKGSDPSIIKLGSHGDLLRCGVRDRCVTRHLLIFGEGS